MDKKTMIESLVRDAHEKGGFTGAWLYAENGEIVSKGAVGFRDAETRSLCARIVCSTLRPSASSSPRRR